MASQPTLVVFAGVNGAGKSTFYQSGLWCECDTDSRMSRINPDEMIVAAGKGTGRRRLTSFGRASRQLVRFEIISPTEVITRKRRLRENRRMRASEGRIAGV